MNTQNPDVAVRVWHFPVSDNDQHDDHEQECYDSADERPSQRCWLVVRCVSRLPYRGFSPPGGIIRGLFMVVALLRGL
jgi:hypothetical protein